MIRPWRCARMLGREKRVARKGQRRLMAKVWSHSSMLARWIWSEPSTPAQLPRMCRPGEVATVNSTNG
jgi:hypothetical protein